MHAKRTVENINHPVNTKRTNANRKAPSIIQCKQREHKQKEKLINYPLHAKRTQENINYPVNTKRTKANRKAPSIIQCMQREL